MGIGISIFLIAVGAILDFGVTLNNTSGFNLHTIGVILMVVGAIGLLASLFMWNSIGGYGFHRRRVATGPGGRIYEDEVG